MRLRVRRLWRRRDADGVPRAPRALVAAAALAITALIGVAMLAPHVEFLRARRSADPVRPCAPGQARDCVGGAMGVIAVPAASSARH